MKVKVGVVGYGTVGKRVAWAATLQPDMELVGIATVVPNWEVISAVKKGIKVYTTKDKIEAFEKRGIKAHGLLEDLVKSVDVVVDATPGGIGAANKKLYMSFGRKALFQGGEKADVADVSFNALVNYSEALGKNYVRVVSCNTTGLLRMIYAISQLGKIKRVRGFIARRGADLKEINRGPIEGYVLDPPKPPSHHALDVKTVIKDLDIVTYAIAAPTTLAHVHMLHFTLEKPVTSDQVLETLVNTPRILLVSGDMLTSTAELRELARDLGRPQGDIYENIVWSDSIWVNGEEIMLTYAVHQEAIIVPENIDAIRAVTRLRERAEESIKITDETLGIKKWL
jgi:glyceraldehyde-3-phosphate dehydrogenase (NAD(P))